MSSRSLRTSRPLIGVTGPDEGGDLAWLFCKTLIWLAGGKALRLTPSRPPNDFRLNGLVLGGGADIDPKRYRQVLLTTLKKESKSVRRINSRFLLSVGIWMLRRFLSLKSSRRTLDTARDELEFGLLKSCVASQTPVLGICRGGQLINVHFGGTLHQDISTFYAERPNLRTIRPRKLIHVEPGTTLFRILCRPRAMVNSLHDQSIDQIGKDLRVSARESNGIVQAIEHRSHPFMIGVQWHPEFMPLHNTQRRFFRQLVQAALIHRELCPVPAQASTFATL